MIFWTGNHLFLILQEPTSFAAEYVVGRWLGNAWEMVRANGLG